MIKFDLVLCPDEVECLSSCFSKLWPKQDKARVDRLAGRAREGEQINMHKRSIGEIKLLTPRTRRHTDRHHAKLCTHKLQTCSLHIAGKMPAPSPSLSLPLPLPLFLSSVSLSDANRTAAMNVSPMICYSTAEEEEGEGEGKRERCD